MLELASKFLIHSGSGLVIRALFSVVGFEGSSVAEE
jgi:hypothetical protein